ncbi:SnoaL-like protein [Herbihabitans rhizosphaerae]|uniref:SnoaL-like protein n=1 Tax=Herbihabitans rhizosphaerae TaxID=1872711 RepID=A0A4Q7KIL6_9PSEU|nr:nuclear transport factor 2 family protein [Herbihabitans rhizosphaerae]RZS32748.1 SnoaL-like protein [Herbihabitans rhizosphaerae]
MGADKEEIVDLVNRFFVSLDVGRFDDEWAAEMFTADVRVKYPTGAYEGIDAVRADIASAFQMFERTQHLAANHLVSVDSDGADVRWDAIHTHVLRGPNAGELFTSGGYYEAEVVRTEHGWRFRRQELNVVWTTGPRPDATLRSTVDRVPS